jgi:hypothetical protein
MSQEPTSQGRDTAEAAPSPEAVLARLRETPLLGHHLNAVRRDLGFLAAQMTARRDATLEPTMLAVGARLAVLDGEPDAISRLATATAAAGSAGDFAEEDALRLLMARVLADHQQTARARDLLAETLGRAAHNPSLAADVHLSKAAVGFGDRLVHLRSALQTLPSPARDHDRLDTLLALGEALVDGAAPQQAEPHLQAALALANEHQATVERGVAAATLAALALETGHHDRAAPFLDEALHAARLLGDDLGLVAHGTVRCALHLAAGELEAAAEHAAAIQAAATRRQNWIGVADAVITQAAADPDLPAQLERLVSEARDLRGRGATAAANLLTARLGELRAQHSRQVVDPLLGLQSGQEEPGEEE